MHILFGAHRAVSSGTGWLVSLALTSAMTSMSVAGTTSWVNPDGGAWSNGANWSDGVPDEFDDVVLPQLDADGYSVQIAQASCHSITVKGEGIELCSGSLTVGESFDIGTLGEAGSVSLSAVGVTALTYRVGVDGGSGTMSLLAGSSCVGGALFVGDSNGPGSGKWSVLGRSQVLIASVELAPSTTTNLEYNKDSAGGVVAGSLVAGGVVHVTMEPGALPPGPAHIVLRSGVAMAPPFGQVDGPTFGAYKANVDVNAYWIAVGPMYEISSLTATPDPAQVPIYVGFRTEFDFAATWITGEPIVGGQYAIAGDPQQVFVEDSVELVPRVAGSLAVTASVSTGAGSFALPMEVDVLPTPPVHYERVDVPAGDEWPQIPGGIVSFSGDASVSTDERYVAFSSGSTLLVPPDPQPSFSNVFVKDRWTGEVEQIDTGGEVGQQEGDGQKPWISADGRYVAFRKRNGTNDSIWMRDRLGGEAWRVSVGPAGEVNNNPCSPPVISGDGKVVLYTSRSTNIVPGLNGYHEMAFRYDVATRTTSVLVSESGEIPDGECLAPAITPDSRFIVIATRADNLVADNAGVSKVVMLDSATGSWERIDLGPNGGSDDYSTSPSVSDDGRFVVFSSRGDNLGAAPDGGDDDVFVRDRARGTTTWVSPDMPGYPSGTRYNACVLSGDGNTIAFHAEKYGSLPGLVVHLDGRDPAPKPIAVGPRGELGTTIGRLGISRHGDVFFTGIASTVVPFAADAWALVMYRTSLASEYDLTGDGAVNAADLAILLAAWGSVDAAADLDHDGLVGASDVALLLSAWSL